MTISTIVHLADPRLTRQQVADLALTEWQAANRAARIGDRVALELHREECERLCSVARLIR